MSSDVKVFTVRDREEWQAMHAAGGLPSQSWSHAWALEASGIDAVLAVVEHESGKMFVPFHVRDFRGDRDVATIVGLSGASFLGSMDPPLECWAGYARACGWVAGYLQLAAGTRRDGPFAEELTSPNVVFLLDIAESNPMCAASETIRKRVQMAERANVQLIEDKTCLAEATVRLYKDTMQRVAAAPLYRFSDESLRRWISDPHAVVLGAAVGSEIVAVSIFLVADNHAEYHLNASSNTGRAASAWLIERAIERLRNRGVTVLNLGGGVRPGDGVYQFKAWFNAPPVPLRAIGQVYDRPKFERLCANICPTKSYFPPYRAV